MSARPWRRSAALLRKETLQIVRDPSSIALALVMPVVLLLLFGYGVSLDSSAVPIAVLVEGAGAPGRELAARFEGSSAFRSVPVGTLAEAEQLLREHEVEGVLHLRSDFAEALAQGTPAPAQLLLNGVDSNRARLLAGYAEGVVAAWSRARRARGEEAELPAVAVEPRVWFSSASRSTDFLVPGLVALVMTLSGTLLTALVIAREWERGTMEALLSTPLRPLELLLAKTLPYYVLGMGGLGLSVGLGNVLFDVPLRGSLAALFLLGSLFLLASLGLGLAISASVRQQFVAAQISIVAGFLPAFFLSGLLFDLNSTPLAIQALSYLVPARYFVSASHTLFLAGDVWSVLAPDALALAVMAVCFGVLARRRIGMRLEG